MTHVTDSDPALFNGYLHDITSRHQVMEELSASRERLAHIARTLQSSLLPPNLPYIPGMELAASYRAFGDGFEVGGDFYDVFELGSGQWVLVLGDVCGKGSEAAVVTALARHTVRAAAVQHRDPAAILDAVNVAIYRQYPDRFCTAVCAVIDTNSSALTLSLGGAPPTASARPDWRRQVGTPGRLLGSFPEWIGSNVTVDLKHNDTLLFFSDGLTEARGGTEEFGEARLSDASLRGQLGGLGCDQPRRDSGVGSCRRTTRRPSHDCPAPPRPSIEHSHLRDRFAAPGVGRLL